MSYLYYLSTLVFIFATAAAGLDIVVAEIGTLSFAQAAMFGIGAYVASSGPSFFRQSVVLGIIGGAAASVAVGMVISLLGRRLQKDEFVLLTFAVAMIVQAIFVNCTSLTGGPFGVRGITPIAADAAQSAASAALVFAGVAISRHLIVRSPWGDLARAVRDNELFVQSVGREPAAISRRGMALAAACAGAAGALFAHFMMFIDPSSFGFDQALFIIGAVIIGRPGSPAGPIIGALLMLLLPEILRNIDIPSSVAPYLRQCSYGLLLTGVAMRSRHQAAFR